MKRTYRVQKYIRLNRARYSKRKFSDQMTLTSTTDTEWGKQGAIRFLEQERISLRPDWVSLE